MKLSSIKPDILRYVVGVSLLLLCLLPVVQESFLQEYESSLNIVRYVLGFCVAVSLITHITRRILFPYLDLKKFTDKALETPLSASLVFIGVSLIISVTIAATAGFFK